MREHRLHVKTLTAGTSVLFGNDAHYLGTVRRADVGDIVELFDGAGNAARATITGITADEIHVETPTPTKRVETGTRLVLAPALLKGDKLADIVRPATELGVEAFHPLITARSDVKILSPNRLTRLIRIAQEASRQSGRIVVPDVHPAAPLKEAALPGRVLVAHPGAEHSIFDAAQLTEPGEVVTMVSGPEGGFTDEEIEFLKNDHGATVISLGSTILRAETAPVAVAAALRLWSTQ